METNEISRSTFAFGCHDQNAMHTYQNTDPLRYIGSGLPIHFLIISGFG